MQIFENQATQVLGIARAKGLRQEHVWQLQGTPRGRCGWWAGRECYASLSDTGNTAGF